MFTTIREFLYNGKNTPGEVVYGRYLRDLPSKKIADIEKDTLSAFCAPPNGLQDVHQQMKKKQTTNKTDSSQEAIIKNVVNWNNRKDYADGLCLSLYERSTHSTTKQFIGDPVADSLAVVTRKNSSILALADGVSWGHKSKLAATCSIYGSVTYLNEHLPTCKNTKDVFRHILKAFERAQQCIVSEQGTMTTLCVGVVVPLHEKNKYGFCVVNVGDSYAYVFNRHYGVKEVTEGSHPIDELRDMRQSGGALGPADGYNPDLSNLTCSFVTLEKGDLVFLCSDGVSDNFDPMVAKFKPNLKGEVISISSSGGESTSDPETENCKNIERGNSEVFEQILPAVLPEIEIHSSAGGTGLPICTNCLKEEQCRVKRNSPVSSTAPEASKEKRKSLIKELFPDLNTISDVSLCSSGSEDDEGKEASVKCVHCGGKLTRGALSRVYSNDRRSSVLDFDTTAVKISTSTSMGHMARDSKTGSEDESQRLKSNSFTHVTQLSSTGVEVEKDATIAKLQNSSTRGKLMSQPSVDLHTGRKTKKELKFNENLTPRERREGALQRMNEIISDMIELDEGLLNINVGEVCGQIVNFVIEKTEEKRAVLEQVPQSELNKMTSKERKVHNEGIKKQLEGVSGKLDHASIVCYEVGYHDDSPNPITLDPVKSLPKSKPEQLPAGVQRSVSEDGAPPRIDGLPLDVSSNASDFDEIFYNEVSSI